MRSFQYLAFFTHTLYYKSLRLGNLTTSAEKKVLLRFFAKRTITINCDIFFLLLIYLFVVTVQQNTYS